MLNIALFVLSFFITICTLLLTGAPPRAETAAVSAPITAVEVEHGNTMAGGDIQTNPDPSPSATKDPHEIPQLLASSALVIDATTGKEIYKKNPAEKKGVASLSKIITAILGVEHLHLADPITATKEATLMEGDAGSIHPGEQFTFEQLLQTMLIESSNDAATAIAEHIGRKLGATTFEESQQIFVDLMNQKAGELGLLNTTFKTPTGLDSDTSTISNYSTAEDLSHLILYSLKYPEIWQISASENASFTSLGGFSHSLHNINILTHDTSGIKGGKTGYTDLSGGSVIVLADDEKGGQKIIIILNSTFDGRFNDAKSLIQWMRNL